MYPAPGSIPKECPDARHCPDDIPEGPIKPLTPTLSNHANANFVTKNRLHTLHVGAIFSEQSTTVLTLGRSTSIRPAELPTLAFCDGSTVSGVGLLLSLPNSDSGPLHSRRNEAARRRVSFPGRPCVGPRPSHQRNPSAWPNQNLYELRGKNPPVHRRESFSQPDFPTSQDRHHSCGASSRIGLRRDIGAPMEAIQVARQRSDHS
jgi:hypothetical protein